jgi:hypothetical protein
MESAKPELVRPEDVAWGEERTREVTWRDPMVP